MRTYIIAEAGVNHNGSIELAKSLIDAALEAGADAIKFQTFKADKMVSHLAPKANYQTKSTPFEESQLEMLQKLELSLSDHQELISYCQKSRKKIEFLSSPFDLDSVTLLMDLSVSRFKIPSGPCPP